MLHVKLLQPRLLFESNSTTQCFNIDCCCDATTGPSVVCFKELSKTCEVQDHNAMTSLCACCIASVEAARTVLPAAQPHKGWLPTLFLLQRHQCDSLQQMPSANKQRSHGLCSLGQDACSGTACSRHTAAVLAQHISKRSTHAMRVHATPLAGPQLNAAART